MKTRVESHVKLLGILWIVYGGLGVFAGIAMMSMSGFLALQSPNPEQMPAFVPHVLRVIGIAVLCWTALQVIAGIGLLQRAGWARVLTLVLGFIALISIPFGTALGIYTIWVLLSGNGARDYDALAARA
jgi:hypothetical protein